MKNKILVVDDEKRMRMLISDFLIDNGYDVIEAADGEDAIDVFFSDNDIKLIILDVMMPHLDGWQVCKEIRKSSDIPIIMLTAKVTEQDELTGFNKGIDDYIKKPFSPTVLVARVNSLFKRVYGNDKIIIKGKLTIDVNNHIITSHDKNVNLSNTEFKLLVYFVQNEGRMLSRENILTSVWGYDFEGTDRTVDTHINRLRDKLANTGEYIKTVRGFGYKFEV